MLKIFFVGLSLKTKNFQKHPTLNIEQHPLLYDNEEKILDITAVEIILILKL